MAGVIPGQGVPQARAAEQAAAVQQAVAPEPTDRDEPNSGPDKVPGVFARNDLVRVTGRWSAVYIVVKPDSPAEGFTEIIRDCGCGGVVSWPTSELVHEWHWMHDTTT